MIRLATVVVLGLLTAWSAAAQQRQAGGAATTAATLPGSQAIAPFETADVVAPPTEIDRLVLAKLKELNIAGSPLCSDAVFVRRAYLDVIGTLPTADEAREFLSDRRTDKRKLLIDRLLERDEFADYWAMKWSDLLRVKAEFPVNLWPNAAQAYHHWILTNVRDNRPYDKFVREMLTSSGSNFHDAPVNFYRAVQGREPETLAQAVALTFMGMRADKWPADRLAGMAAFFSQVGYKSTAEWKEEVVFFDQGKALKGPAVFPDGTAAKIEAGQDPRRVFADWLVKPENPYFAKNICNRVWSWLLGRGIVHEVDDIRPDNSPSNPELLAYLERGFVASHYDMKNLYRLILNSQTYQRSSIERTRSAQADANFAHYPLRRLDAEVISDAICQITGTHEQYTSAIPEPFTFIPQEQRSIALPDGSIGSAFLELFGRSPRDTGLESERANKPTAGQRLYMLNSTHLQKKLESRGPLQAVISSRKPGREVVTDVYLMILSRYPTDQEVGAVMKYSQANKPRDAMIDLSWALMNSAEFLYRH